MLVERKGKEFGEKMFLDWFFEGQKEAALVEVFLKAQKETSSLQQKEKKPFIDAFEKGWEGARAQVFCIFPEPAGEA